MVQSMRGIGVLTVAALMWAAPAAWAGPGEGAPTIGGGEILASLVNFAVYAALLYLLFAKGFTKFFRERRSRLLAEMDEATKLREAAEQQFAMYKAKLDQFEQEREQILREFREIGELERDRIIRDAEASAARLREDTLRQVDQEARAARTALVREIVQSALAEAQAEVERRMTPDAHRKLVEERLRTVAETGRLAAH